MLMTCFFSTTVCVIGMYKLIEQPLEATIYAKVKPGSVKQEELKRSALRAASALSCIPDSGL